MADRSGKRKSPEVSSGRVSERLSVRFVFLFVMLEDFEQIVKAVEVVGREVIDVYTAFAVVAVDRHFCGEHALHALHHILELDRLRGRLGLVSRGRGQTLYQLFKVAHGEFVVHRLLRDLELFVGVVDGYQTTRVAFGELARRDQVDNGGGKGQQTQKVGDRGTRLAYPIGDLLLRVGVFVHELLDGGRDLDGVEVFALEVLDKRDLLDLLVGIVAYYRGHGRQTRFLRRAPSALARDEHVIVRTALDEYDGRYHAVEPYAVRQLQHSRIVELLARLVFVGVDVRDGYLLRDVLLLGRVLVEVDVPEQRAQSSAKTVFSHVYFLRA